ncbi:hypothetical protein M0811_13816 [Anaeramoeba ignava]|uniref:Phospholipase C/D domain-containing protein n=1 Tax=Anaeramoeba ignava TaxID=1746090 RepID=A0A9Q0M0A9_ANAIG|nr:hypothetical protein M0811_13816 [Anaeramoeba ignava]
MKLHFIFFLIFFLKLTFECGFVTHFYISQNAIGESENQVDPTLYNLLSSHLDTVQLGSCTPDWGYSLLINKYHELSDIIHEEGFLYASFDYLKEKYSDFSDSEAQKYLAYFIGIGGHQTADIYWHGYNGDPLAFMFQVAKNDFGSDSIDGIIHQVMEATADVFLFHEHDPHVEFKWWIPAQAVCDVYMRYKEVEVSTTEFIIGMDVLKVAMILLKTLNWVGSELGMLIEPWSHANYITWGHGGIDNCIDMSVPYYTDAWLYLNDKQSVVLPHFNYVSYPYSNTGDTSFFENILPAARELIDSGIISIDHTQNDDGSVTSEIPHIADFSKFLGLIQRYFGINTLEHLAYQFLNEFL